MATLSNYVCSYNGFLVTCGSISPSVSARPPALSEVVKIKS